MTLSGQSRSEGMLGKAVNSKLDQVACHKPLVWWMSFFIANEDAKKKLDEGRNHALLNRADMPELFLNHF